ncbi:hypothetical protein [Marinicella litoralis]|uniref:Uncharacterized protein n=1 Tax=Marinicella litoralis TaxID=644220 RepID=A0A4V3DIM4_9GAMM|nr:hypothetical protein [Marinicella litoralis]TDR22671.1 hypothetical protein C8D91_1163 [Marinicella litoralis]
MNNDYKTDINYWLNKQTQENPPRDAFDGIMDKIHQSKRQRSFRLPAMAAAVFAGILLWMLPQFNNSQSDQLQLLTRKISMIEHVVRNEVVNHTAPGSPVLEKMVSMENWLDQLDLNIAQTDDTNQKLELLHAKLEILDDLVALHKRLKPRSSDQVI